MEEIKSVFETVMQEKADREAFSRVVHKSKMTLSFLNDDTLTMAVRQANETIKSGDLTTLDIEFQAHLRQALDSIISDLQSLR